MARPRTQWDVERAALDTHPPGRCQTHALPADACVATRAFTWSACVYRRGAGRSADLPMIQTSVPLTAIDLPWMRRGLVEVASMFGVAVATPVIALGLGLTLAAALTSPRSI